MKNVMYAFVFVVAAAVSAYAYPPVTETSGDESPAVATETSEVAHLTDPCVSRSAWCMEEYASEETGYEAEADDNESAVPESFGNMYAADPDEGESDMYMSALQDMENPDGVMSVACLF